MKNTLIKLKAIIICSLIVMSFLSCTNEEDESIIRTVTVEESFKIIKAGESFEIKLSDDSANQKLTFKSYNLEVATIDDKGVVTGVGVGFAIISIENENGAEATIELTVEKADFHVPAEIIGTWSGVKIELINKSTGDVYDEATILGMLNAELTDEEKQKWFNTVRTQFSYQMNSDNTIIMTIPTEDGGEKYLDGELDADDKYKNIYHALFDIESSGIQGIETLRKQSMTYDGEYVAVETPFGPEFILVTYYTIERE